jgi:hypothetical protein
MVEVGDRVVVESELRLPPKAARTEGPPRTRACRMDQSREAHLAAGALQSPEGGHD